MRVSALPPIPSTRRFPVLSGTIAAMLLAATSLPPAHAVDGVWADKSGIEFWTDDDPFGNWFNNIVANGTDGTAFFDTLDLDENQTVELFVPRTIGHLSFADTTPNFDWIIGNNSDPANTLTLSVTTGTPTINVSNRTATINATLISSAGFRKNGAGNLTLTGTALNLTPPAGQNANILVAAGSLTFSGGAAGAGGALQSGGLDGRGLITIDTTGAINFPGALIAGNANDRFNSVGGIAGSDGTTGAGAVVQTSGTITYGAGAGNLELGPDQGATRTTYGSYTLAGGSLTTNGPAGNGTGIRVGAGGFGVFTQTGGALTVNRFFVAGSGTGLVNNTAGLGIITLSGGSTTISAGSRGLILGDRTGTVGILNIGTQAGGDNVLANGDTTGVRVGGFNAATTTGIVNLNSGRVDLNTSRGFLKQQASAVGIVNLNGATVRAGNASVSIFESTLTSVNVFRGGITIDSQANNPTIPAALSVTLGNGIYPAGGTIAIPSDGGADYLGAPIVTVSGGSGTGARAIANVTDGVVTGVTFITPGQNYVVGDTVSFAFESGGSTTAATTFNYQLTASDVASNATGGLTKIGSGSLTLSNTNTYTGTTTISNGNLIVTGGIAGSTTEINGGTLSGTGTTGPVNVNAGGTLAPGVAVATTLNTGALTLDGGSTYRLDLAATTTDQANVTGTVTLDGTITLDLTLTAQPTFGTNFTIVNSTGGINGYSGGSRFSYLGEVLDDGETFTATTGAFSQVFQINYAADAGNDIVLAAVPEPSAATALLGGIGLALGGMRRRRASR